MYTHISIFVALIFGEFSNKLDKMYVYSVGFTK